METDSSINHWMNRLITNPAVTEDQIANIANLIFLNSVLCTDSIKSEIFEYCSSEKEKNSKWIHVLLEFMYFFYHMTNRAALSVIGHQKRLKLQSDLLPYFEAEIFEVFFINWPSELKEKLKIEILDKLNQAEIDYSECSRFIIKDNTSSNDALFSKFANNVALLIHEPIILTIQLKTLIEVIDAWRKMKLKSELEILIKFYEDE